MEQTKGLLIGAISKSFSLSVIKKAVVLFVVACMFVNGFVAGADNISKNSLAMVLVVATQNIFVSVFARCNDSLMQMSNKLSKNIRKSLAPKIGSKENRALEDNDFEDTGIPDDTASTGSSSIMPVRFSINEEGKTVQDIKVASAFLFVPAIKLFKLYMNYKIPPGESARVLLIITFMVFILAIRRRKEIDSSANIVFNREKKTRISA